MKQLFAEAARLLAQKESFVLVTIFHTSGSAPRTAGAKMIVRQDGSIFGTIGGGRLEADMGRLAGRVFQHKHSLIQPFNLAGTDVSGMDMICGGSGEALLDFIDAADAANRTMYQAMLDALNNREKAWLITELDCRPESDRPRQQCLVKPGSLIGEFIAPADFLAKLTSGPGKLSIHAEVIDDRRFLVEAVRSPKTVYIFGAGHVGKQVAMLAELVGFRTVVLDDRPEFANRERFPGADIRLLESLGQLPELPIDQDSYLVIVTRGHLHDKTVLAKVLATPAGYIGMIGSKTKRDMIYRFLSGEGYNQSDFARIHSPIGLAIGAETPEEIAVSIVAELIQARSGQECPEREGSSGKSAVDALPGCCGQLE